MNTQKSKSAHRESSGFQWMAALFYATWVLFVSLVLLYFNSHFCFALVALVPMPADSVLAAALTQMFFYVVPLVMLFVEWYVFDRMRRLFA